MLTPVKNKFVAILCILSVFSLSTSAYANTLENELSADVVTNIVKGEVAPFDGVLLSKGSAAKLFGELHFFEESCKLTLSKELDIANIRYNSEIDALKLKLDVEIIRTDRLLEIKNERIQFLEKNWQPQAWYESGEFWFSMGILGGILITVASGYAISQAAK